MPSGPASPPTNRLLSCLPEEVLRRWSRDLEPVTLRAGQLLQEAGEVPGHAVFPTTAVVSLLQLLHDRGPTEVSVVGREGMLGISLVLGGGAALGRAVVQTAGQGWRLPAAALEQEFGQGGAAMHVLLRYAQALITQTAQTAVCNRLHTVDQQLCRWLLMRYDRLDQPVLRMTQSEIAALLGVRRVSVSESAAKLQQAGVLHYVRGQITLLDPAALQQRSCECYRVIRREYERLLPERDAP